MSEIKHHTDLLNALIAKYNLKSYLEIGVQNPANNFDKVKCGVKVGVDPGIAPGRYDPCTVLVDKTSDNYFKELFESDIKIGIHESIRSSIMGFDLIFIDGLHHADQVKRDFENALRCLSDNGFIVIHDVLPENEAGTIVPRQTKVWWGDVYKWAMRIREYTGITFKTFNIDNGCMVVRRAPMPGIVFEIHQDTWEHYLLHRVSSMNVTDEVII